MKKAVLLLVAILAWPIGAQAITGNELLAECRSREPHSRGYCLGLIVGAAHAAGLVRMIAPQPIPVLVSWFWKPYDEPFPVGLEGADTPPWGLSGVGGAPPTGWGRGQKAV
jgi:hypothetical protein